MIKAIVLDMYGVIVKQTGDGFVPYVQQTFPNMKREEICIPWFKADVGELTSLEVWETLGYRGDLEKIEKDYLDTIEMNDGFLKFIESVRKRYRLAIISNDSSRWSEYLREKFDINKYFDVISISGDLKMQKPDERIFKLTMEKLGVNAGECLYVDDRRRNLGVAQKLGMKAVMLNSRNVEWEGNVVQGFEELAEIIDGNSNREELLFYNAYEEFYEMAKQSRVFKTFCQDAFGADFSQDGFSDIKQIEMILKYVPSGANVHILDIGCGNGKMLGYLQQKTGAYIHGFDYSGQAIETARTLFTINAQFEEGIIGEIEFPAEKFDLIISMDTMYFAKDMATFVSQIKRWLKPGGAFFVGYQEGDIMPKTRSVRTAVLTKALEQNGLKYEVVDITEENYNMLKRKREAAMRHKAEFEAEGYKNWFDMLMGQTECVTKSFEQFAKRMTRYIYVVRK